MLAAISKRIENLVRTTGNMDVAAVNKAVSDRRLYPFNPRRSTLRETVKILPRPVKKLERRLKSLKNGLRMVCERDFSAELKGRWHRVGHSVVEIHRRRAALTNGSRPCEESLRSFSIVIIQHPTKLLAAMDLAFRLADFLAWIDQLVAQSLMVPLAMIVKQIGIHRAA